MGGVSPSDLTWPALTKPYGVRHPGGREYPPQAGARQYRELAAKHELPVTYRPIQLATLGAARVLVEGLKRAGRDLSRDRLLEALEGLYEFETGLTPSVTYGPNRRLAVQGAHVMSADLQHGQFLRTGAWRAPR